MFIDDDYDNERQELIQNILNRAMGLAGKSLALAIRSEVDVQTPRVHWVNNNNLRATLAKLALPECSIVMRQFFRGHLRGEMLILLEHGSKHYRLGESMGYEGEMSASNLQELTLEFASILSGACISGLSDQLNISLNFGSPSLLSNKASVDDILSGKALPWTDALFMDVGYTVSSISYENPSHSLFGRRGFT